MATIGLLAAFRRFVLGDRMFRSVAAVLFASLALVGCLDVPEGIEPGKTYVLGTEGSWTDAERAELASACDDWRSFTAGALDCRLAAGDEQTDARFIRGTAGANYGRLDASDRAFYVDVERLAADGWTMREGLGALARNMIGQAARIPEHSTAGVMSDHDVRREYSTADRDSCRSAGFCL